MAGPRESRDPAAPKQVSGSATGRVCSLWGSLFALVLPPGEPETDRLPVHLTLGPRAELDSPVTPPYVPFMLAAAVQRVARSAFSSLPVSVQAATDLIRPSKWAACGGPMNGQQARQRLVRSVMGLGVARVIETGTFRGDTTRWFAGFGVPVWTVEVQPRNYWVSRYRLLAHRTLHLACGDSVAALRRWIASGAFSTGLSLFYLDAH